jgi:hypothetical protein
MVIKLRKLAIVVALVAVLALTILYGFAVAGEREGPAPNSGDGISDGSGMDDPHNADSGANSPGPAPNSGDGIPDGSGF